MLNFFAVRVGGQVLNVEFLRRSDYLRRALTEVKRSPTAAATRPMLKGRSRQARAIRAPGIAAARPVARRPWKFDAQLARPGGGRHTGEFNIQDLTPLSTEVAISRPLFAEILRLIDGLRPAPLPP